MHIELQGRMSPTDLHLPTVSLCILVLILVELVQFQGTPNCISLLLMLLRKCRLLSYSVVVSNKFHDTAKQNIRY
jgi:hypothetical protein